MHCNEDMGVNDLEKGFVLAHISSKDFAIVRWIMKRAVDKAKCEG